MRIPGMDSRRGLIAALLLSLTVAGTTFGADPAHTEEQVVLDRFLLSKDLQERKKAFSTILANDASYRDLVLAKLQKSSAVPTDTPDSLIYLAASLKDPRYVDPLSKLINNTSYSGDRCVYSCPIVFALTILRCFAGAELPTNLDTSSTPVKDLRRTIQHVQSMPIEPQTTSTIAQGPGIDQLIQDIEKRPMSEVLQIAGPETKNARRRMAAAYVLQAKITDPKYLDDLYWLAATDLNDASGEYRAAIYSAIYRVETVKLKHLPESVGKSKN